MKSAIKSCLSGMLITCLLNTAVISMDAPSSPPRAPSPAVDFAAMDLDQVTAFIDDSGWSGLKESVKKASEQRYDELKAAKRAANAAAALAGDSEDLSSLIRHKHAPVAPQPTSLAPQSQPAAPAVDLSNSNREQLEAFVQQHGGWDKLDVHERGAFMARNQELLAGKKSPYTLPPSSGASVPAPQPIGVNFLQMDHEKLQAYVTDRGGWESLDALEQEAFRSRSKQLKDAKDAVDALRSNANKPALASPQASPVESPIPSPRKSLPQADPNGGKGLRASRFEEWCNHARANKMRSAAIVAGVVFGSDLIYAYYSKITPEEQSKGFAQKLLLAASRTKTAALLGGAKNMVGSLLSRKKA